MPLTSFNAVGSSSWSLKAPNAGFSAKNQSDAVSWSLLNVNLTTWNQCLAAIYTIAPSASQVIDLTSLSNLVGESFGFGHVKSLWVEPVGAAIHVGPLGATNALQWFWDDTTAYTTVNNGGILFHADSAADTSTVVDATHKILTITNIGIATATVIVEILGSTT